jgi:hypothetical protein
MVKVECRTVIMRKFCSLANNVKFDIHEDNGVYIVAGTPVARQRPRNNTATAVSRQQRNGIFCAVRN